MIQSMSRSSKKLPTSPVKGKRRKSPPARDEEISALIEVLHKTGERLEELTAGEVDTVADRDGRTFVLLRAQEQLRHIEAAKQAAIVNALPAHIALLDNDGLILSVNEAWRRFVCVNAVQGPGHAIGVNYLGICTSARGDGAAEAYQIAAGIRSVLSGGAKSFSIEFPCHFPTEQRWLLLTVTPLADDRRNGAVVMYLDVTAQRQAEASLRESERRFSDLLGNVDMVSVMLDTDGCITYCNDYLLRLSDWRHEQVIGRNWFELFIPPEITDLKAFHAAILAGVPATLHHENEILTRSGERRLIRWNNSVLRSGAGDVIGTASIGEDITEQKRTEIRIKRLNRVYAVLSGINTLIVRVRDRDELFREACRVAVEDGGFRMTLIAIVDRSAKIVPIASAGKDEELLSAIKNVLSSSEGAANTMVARAIREKIAVVSNDSQGDPKVLFGRQYAASGVRSMAILPLIVADDAIGVLALYAAETGFFDQEEMKLLMELAGDIAFALEHISRQQKLDKLARMRAVSSEINVAIVRIHEREALLRETCRIAAEHGKFELIWIAVLDQAKQKVKPIAWKGFSPDAAHSVSWTSIETARGALSEAILTRKPVVRNDIQALLPVGQLRQEALQKQYRSTVCLPFMVDDSVVGAIILFAPGLGFFDDDEVALLNEAAANVSFALEHIEKEEKIARLSRIQTLMSSMSSVIVRVRDRQELFNEACRIAVEHGKFGIAWIGTLDPLTQDIEPAAWAGIDAAKVSSRRRGSRGDDPNGQGLAARAVREKTALFDNDIVSRPNIGAGGRKEAISRGYCSLIALPLLADGVVLGTLSLFAKEPDFFDAEEVRLLTELAGNIAFAVTHIDKQGQLDYLAYYDVLTGLANRSLFLERVAQYKRSAAGSGHKLALYLIDLERFKNINDSLGRPAGDSLLRQVAEWLTGNVGDANLLSRVGSDHFAVVMPEVQAEGDVARLLEKMIEAFLEHPFRLDDAVFRIAAKVGVALFPDDGETADILFRNAEAALKKAKASGDRYLFYTRQMTEVVAGNLTLENQLRQALDNEEFVLHYQPKVNLASGKLTGAEALIRWNDPRTGLVPPGRFIPILEETGLIYEVGRWALKQAIADYLRWRATGLTAVRIAVNVSPLQLRHRGFIAEIKQAIAIDAHAAAGLELEITESLIMEDVKHNIASLEAIRAMGVTIAIDDFGTGFSSLAYLSKLPVDTLKIDRSFVNDMAATPQGLALVSTIISLAHALTLKVVAEGVETEEQSRLLRLLKCDEMQGFLFSKPVPGEIFEANFLAPASSDKQIELA
jgi:diguanylate cyclase (GGDEF)-like protein/PAS domain S-box-containing protein